MEVSPETQAEMKEEQQRAYDAWNKKINEVTHKVITVFKEEQLNIKDCQETVKLVGANLNGSVGALNINYVLNQVDFDARDKKKKSKK